MSRIILHVDMDAFFAAIEQRNHPEYTGKPLVVGADPKKGSGRGVVSTCSYEARKFGIHSAMPISRAYKLCPHAIFVPPNGKLYGQVSREIFKIFYNYTDRVEPLSIDEAFLDIAGSIRLFGDAITIAQKIKAEIKSAEKLTASVGLAPNKYLAKIASDLEKPDGLVVVEPDKIHEFLNPLPISRLWGAGEKTVQKLKLLGIHTIGDLAAIPKDVLDKKFGKTGDHFYRLAHGIDNREVIPEHGVKSVSNEHTFYEDVLDLDIVMKSLFKLSEKVGYRLRNQSLQGRTIHLKLRYEGFETITRNKTLNHYTANTEAIYKVIQQLFTSNYQQGRRVRLVGVGVSGFEKEPGMQLSLFENGLKEDTVVDKLEDLIREKFGRQSISRAESIENKDEDL